MLNKVSSLMENAQGELKAGVLYYGIDEYVNPVVRSFYEKFPGIQLEILSYQVHDVIRDLKNRTIDIGLLMKTEELSQEQYCFFPLAKEKIYAFMASNHELAGANNISLDQINCQKLLVLESEPVYTKSMERILNTIEFEPSETLYTKQLDTMLPVLDATCSIFLGPEMLKNMNQKQLSVCGINAPELTMEIGFYYRLDNQNPAIHMFLNCAAQAPGNYAAE